MKIRTKDLCLCKLSAVKHIDYKYNFLHEIVDKMDYFSDKERYALAWGHKNWDKDNSYEYFEDIFTKSTFSKYNMYQAEKGTEYVIAYRQIITNKEYLSFEEAVRILKELNPTCIIEKEKVKVLAFGRKKEK